jgi:hypothetical protein
MGEESKEFQEFQDRILDMLLGLNEYILEIRNDVKGLKSSLEDMKYEKNELLEKVNRWINK